MASWLDDVCDGLERDRWSIKENVAYRDWDFPIVARHSAFSFTRLSYYERFFIFADFDVADRRDVMEFSRDAFRCAQSRCTGFLPNGVFQSTTCFSVAIVQDIDDRSAREIERSTPPRHWGAAEYPIVYDAHHDELIYFKGTAMWGALYYSNYRNDIRRYLDWR